MTKKKILVHEIKFFFYNLVLVYVDLLGGIYCPSMPEDNLKTQQESQLLWTVLSSLMLQQMVLLQLVFSNQSS